MRLNKFLRYLNIFVKHSVELENKWWHRFFKIMFSILIIIFFLICLSLVEPSKIAGFNISIDNNLYEFTAQSDKTIKNTVPLFIRQDGDLGCLDEKTKTIKWINYYSLEEDGVCSSDVAGNIDSIIESMISRGGNENLEEERFKGVVLDDLKTNMDRKCYLTQDTDCLSKNIVKYHKNFIYYFEIFLLTTIYTVGFYLLLTFIYFKGFIYIIYGNKK